METSTQKENNKNRRKNLYESRKAKGLCPSCGKNAPTQDKTWCSACLEKSRLKAEKRIADGVCIGCGNKVEILGRRNCKACNQKRGEINRKKSVESGFCQRCHAKPAEKGKTVCQNCNERNIRNSVVWRRKTTAERKSLNLCAMCGKTPPLSVSVKNAVPQTCETCLLKDLSRGNLGSSKHWENLKQIFIKQNGKCVYTGIELILGVNASVDHILPVSVHPELKNNLENIQWVERRINSMKNNLLPNEFISLIKQIAEHCHLV